MKPAEIRKAVPVFRDGTNDGKARDAALVIAGGFTNDVELSVEVLNEIGFHGAPILSLKVGSTAIYCYFTDGGWTICVGPEIQRFIHDAGDLMNLIWRVGKR